MTRTQIQLPDDTFARAKKLCEAREISLAELARRGIEYILSVYAPEPDANRDWQPPNITLLSGIVEFPGKFCLAAGAALKQAHQPRLHRVQHPFPRNTRSFF